jgi:hypothetical protein
MSIGTNLVSDSSLLLLELGLDLLQAIDLVLELIGSLLSLLLDRVGVGFSSGSLLLHVALGFGQGGLVALVLLYLDLGGCMSIRQLTVQLVDLALELLALLLALAASGFLGIDLVLAVRDLMSKIINVPIIHYNCFKSMRKRKPQNIPVTEAP